MMNRSFEKRLQQSLRKSHSVNSITTAIGDDEIQSIVEAIMEERDLNDQVQTLADFIGISVKDAESILRNALYDDQSSSSSDHDEEIQECIDDVNEDDQYILDGECELCERDVKVTKHHLIPRETWKYIRPRFLSAAEFFLAGDIEKTLKILDIGDILPYGLQKRHFESALKIKLFLAGNTADLCVQCHRYIHERFTNKELAEKYNTIEKLLLDEKILKYCKWASKQRSGKSR